MCLASFFWDIANSADPDQTPQSSPGGCTLIFSYIRRLGSFFWFKILNFNIFGGFQKNEYFLGYEDFLDIFWGPHKIGLYLGSFLCILGFFLKVNVQYGVFLGLQKFQIFFGCLKFLIFFGVNGRCWA